MSSIIAHPIAIAAPAPLEHTLATHCVPSTAPASEDLSWHPSIVAATGPSPAHATNNKYRTLASINAMSALSSIPAPTPITTDNINNLYSNLTHSSPKATFFGHASSLHHHQHAPAALQSAAAITAAIQEMDKNHGTCFLTWIHNPANLDYVSLRLRPLCLQYPLVSVANVLRWIGADWSSQNCKALFRSVTHGWDQTRRRMLAYLLIKDEDMRQKAKAKLIEFVKKNEAKNQLRLQQQQQQMVGVSIDVPVPVVAATIRPTPTTDSAMQPSAAPATHAQKSIWTDLFEGSTQLNNKEENNDSLFSSIAAASIITGLDVLDLPAAAVKPAAPIPPVKLVSMQDQPAQPAAHRFSPYAARRAHMAQSLLAAGQTTHRHMPILPRTASAPAANAAVSISASAVPAAVGIAAQVSNTTTATTTTTTTPISIAIGGVAMERKRSVRSEEFEDIHTYSPSL